MERLLVAVADNGLLFQLGNQGAWRGLSSSNFQDQAHKNALLLGPNGLCRPYILALIPGRSKPYRSFDRHVCCLIPFVCEGRRVVRP